MDRRYLIPCPQDSDHKRPYEPCCRVRLLLVSDSECVMSGGGVFATVELNMQRSSVSQRVENTRDER